MLRAGHQDRVGGDCPWLASRLVPRQRRRDDRRVDGGLDLLLHVCLDGGLVDTTGPHPTENLVLSQIRVRNKLGRIRCGEAGRSIAGAVVLFASTGLGSIATPSGGHNNISEAAFGGLYPELFDNPSSHVYSG